MTDKKCHICSSEFEEDTTICKTNGHIFQIDLEGNMVYMGRMPKYSPKQFVFPKGYLTYFMKMQCQLCLSSLDGILEYDDCISLKCINHGHDSYLTTEIKGDKCYDVITIIDRGVQTHIPVKQKIL